MPVVTLPRDKARTRYTEWKRNPFMLADELMMGAGGLVLNGIVWDREHPLVIINDQLLSVGDTIEEREITKITQTQVFLKEGSAEYSLDLGEP